MPSDLEADLCPACEHVAARLGLTPAERASILRTGEEQP